ncbi:single-stranded DNA-binding protein [Staphylococcus aureus]|uniref:single-stranded DNA-binding protein n=1 Tax=Staphylococcus aureus TaxID=1280 RepID=UPI001F00154A|nr:single-stranded DNA-binding protein [Staphylococcus aureus]
MTYHERVLALRAESKRTAFDFRFEDLFSKEEWLSMSLAERQKAEKAFRHEVKNMDDVRMPFSSVHDAQVVNVNIKMYINDCIRMYKIVC